MDSDFADLENFHLDQDDLRDFESLSMEQHYSHRENDYAHYFASITNGNFKKRYRMSKSSFNSLCNELNLPENAEEITLTLESMFFAFFDICALGHSWK